MSKATMFGLCAMALGLMAMWAGSAQAAKWEVGGSTTLEANVEVNQIEQLEREVNGTKVKAKDGTLVTKVAGVKVEITCTAAEFSLAFLEKEGRVKGAAGKFAGCSTLLNEKTSAACGARSSGQTPGVIRTHLVKALLQLLGGQKVVLVEPEVGTEFVAVELGEECAVGEKLPIFGKLALEDPALETKSILHLIKENATNTAMFALSNTAEHKATIVGSALIELTTLHFFDEWRGLAE